MDSSLDRILSLVGYEEDPVYYRKESGESKLPEFPLADVDVLKGISEIAKKTYKDEVGKLGAVSLSESDMISIHESLACGAVTYAIQEYENGLYINSLFFRDWEYVLNLVTGEFIGFSGGGPSSFSSGKYRLKRQKKSSSNKEDFISDFILSSFTDTLKEASFIDSFSEKLSSEYLMSKDSAKKTAGSVVSRVFNELNNIKTAGFLMPIDVSLDDVPLTDLQYGTLKKSYESKKSQLSNDLDAHFGKCSFVKNYINTDTKTSAQGDDFPIVNAAHEVFGLMLKSAEKHLKSFGVVHGPITYSTENVSKFVKLSCSGIKAGDIVSNRLLGIKGKVSSVYDDQVVIDWGNTFVEKLATLTAALKSVEDTKFSNRKKELNRISFKLANAINVETHQRF